MPYNHILSHMKTTLDLPDDLLIEAKSMAARQRTTLKAIVEHALRREIQGRNEAGCDAESRYDRNELGFLMLKHKPSTQLPLEEISKLEDAMDEEELQAAIHPGRNA